MRRWWGRTLEYWKCEEARERGSFLYKSSSSKDPLKQGKGTRSNGEANGSTMCRVKKSDPDLEVIKWIIFGRRL